MYREREREREREKYIHTYISLSIYIEREMGSHRGATSLLRVARFGFECAQ